MEHLNKRRNVLILMILFISVVIILFLSYNKYKDTSTFQDSPAWSNSLIITFNGHEYNVTDKTTTDVGNKIGTVSYHGTISNSYYLYAINNTTNNAKIAVKAKQGFLIANIK